MNAEADRESILPYIKMFQQLIRYVQVTVVATTTNAFYSCQSAWCRRRPFLIKSLENTLSKLLKSLDFYDNAARHKVAIGTISKHSYPIDHFEKRRCMTQCAAATFLFQPCPQSVRGMGW